MTPRNYHPKGICRRFIKGLLFISLPMLFAMCIQDDPDAGEVFSLKPGDPLPEFSVKDNTGRVISDVTLRGKVCLIAFVNTGCPDCRRELPEIEQAFRSFSKDEDICFIAISRSQGYNSLTEYWVENGFTLPYAAQEDDSVFQKFASQNIPRIYIASPEGIILYTFDDSSFVTAETIIKAIHSSCSIPPSPLHLFAQIPC